jgi:hypothetical protein
MAKRMDTTDLWITEPLSRGMRRMILRFAALVRSLIVLTAAEQDLGEDADQDPAFAAYTGAVDTARTRALSHAEALAAPEAERGMARGMQIVAQMIRTVITTDAPSEVAMIRNICAMRGKTILLPVFRYRHPHYNALMDHAFDALEGYIALPGTGGAVADPAFGTRLAPGMPVAHTTMSQCFTALLGAMERFLRADQQLQRVVAGDVLALSFAQGMQRAEAERTALNSALHSVMAADLRRREDGLLWELGYALFSLIEEQDDDARQRRFERLLAAQQRFVVPGHHAGARHLRQTQERFFTLTAQLMQLADFGGDGPEGDGSFGPMLAA